MNTALNQAQVERQSASAWSTPFVLMIIWGVLQLWLTGSPIESLGRDLLLALIYSSVIAGSMLPAINRFVDAAPAPARERAIVENVLGCLLAVLALTVLLAIALVVNRDDFRDPLHLSLQLVGVALMSICWILTTVLLSRGQDRSVLRCYFAGTLVLIVALVYQPMAGLSYHSLAWLSAIAVTVLAQARALTQHLPSPQRIGFRLAFGHTGVLRLSVAGVSLCLSLWLSRPSAHTTGDLYGELLLLEQYQSITYLILVPVAMLAWKPLEVHFKGALSAFERAAREGGSLEMLDYQKDYLMFQSQSGIQRVHIALIAAVVVCMTLNKIYIGQFATELVPAWLMPLTLVYVALQMVALCAMRLLFFLRRDRELLSIAFVQLAMVSVVFNSGLAHHGALVVSYSLIFSSFVSCLLAIWLLRHRLQRLDYLFFMGG